jgi:isopenicillin-N epimerase
VYFPNVTHALNVVARSVPLIEGDEVLTTNHEYGALDRTWRFICQQRGATYKVQPLPDPLADPADAVEALWSGVTPRTKVLFMSHVTSPTAVTLPIRPLIARARSAGIVTAIDGAHAPGQIALDLHALGVDFYGGNCHKWLCAPKGSAFLWVRRDRRADLHPVTISHGLTADRPDGARFHLEFDWTGTADPTAWLSVPKAIEYLGSLLPGGWPAVMARNHRLAVEMRRRLAAVAGTALPCPDTMVGSLASIPLPDGLTSALAWRRPDPIQGRLYGRWGIEAAVMSWPAPPKRLLRISVQLYNEGQDYARLAEALAKELADERATAQGATG